MTRTRSLVVAAEGELVVERDPGRPSGRLLRQADMDASYVDLAQAGHLEFDYLRWARLVVRSFDAERVLHVGGAACTLARALLAENPASRQDVIEIDERVFAIARAHLGLRRQVGLKLRVGDGRAAVSGRADDSADAVMIDAFVGARVPHHLVTTEAFAECSRVAPLTIVNVVDTTGWPQARAVAAGLGENYTHVSGLWGGTRRGGNMIIFGAAREPSYGTLESSAAADACPARLLRARDLVGASAWQD